MKHITYADKSLLVDDVAADLIVEYAVALAKAGSADSVQLRGYGADGDEVVGSFVLTAGTVLMAETTHSSIDDPDNSEAVDYMRKRLLELTSPSAVQPYGDSDSGFSFDPDFSWS